MRSMARLALVGCMAVAALGATAILDVGSRTADAASSVSRFAGSYVGGDPHVYTSWAVTVSDGGQIKGSRSNGSFSGRVDSDGSYSFTVSAKLPTMPPWRGGGSGFQTYRYTSVGHMELDADGNIVGTEDTGRTFFWARQ